MTNHRARHRKREGTDGRNIRMSSPLKKPPLCTPIAYPFGDSKLMSFKIYFFRIYLYVRFQMAVTQRIVKVKKSFHLCSIASVIYSTLFNYVLAAVTTLYKRTNHISRSRWYTRPLLGIRQRTYVYTHNYAASTCKYTQPINHENGPIPASSIVPLPLFLSLSLFMPQHIHIALILKGRRVQDSRNTLTLLLPLHPIFPKTLVYQPAYKPN